MFTEVEIRRKMPGVVVIVLACLTMAFACTWADELFTHGYSDKHAVWFPFLLFTVSTLFVLYLYLDKKPIYKITSEGIAYRKFIFIRKLNGLFRWDEAEYYYEKPKMGRYPAKLVLNHREYDHLSITLDAIDMPKEKLLAIIKQKELEYGFYEAGFE